MTHDHSHGHSGSHAHEHGHHEEKVHEHHEHHGHSHEHGADCSDCGPKVVTADDVKDVEVPEWKKKALQQDSAEAHAAAAPFGLSWTTEASTTASNAHEKPHSAETHHDHGHHHHHDEHHSHGHSHDHLEDPGKFEHRLSGINQNQRDWTERAFTVGLGGPVGSGKTALMLALCRKLRNRLSVVAVTNDIFTREDGEFLTKHEALPKERIMAVETGGCPHAAIREDISANLHACERLTALFSPVDICLLESGGDNLAANFSPELADFSIYVIDVAGGDKVPRKGGPGVTQSDVLVINKTDLADVVGASLDVMERDAKRMRGEGPFVFAQARENLGLGVDDIVNHIMVAWSKATGKSIPKDT